MKKISVILIMLLSLFIGIKAQAVQLYYNDSYHDYEDAEITLKVNGKQISSLQTPPVIIDGRTMVPVRDVFEALGSTVLWHDDTCQVEITDNGVSVLIRIGDRDTYVNGELIRIADNQPLPMLIGYNPTLLKSMVPVRFVAEKLGYVVEWDDAARVVSISTKQGNNTNLTEEPIADGYGNFSGVKTSLDDDYDYVYIKTRYGISPEVSRLPSPDRIVFDFKGAAFSTAGETLNLNGKCVSTVRYANYNGQARVVLELTASAQPMIMSSNLGILIRVQPSSNTQVIYDAFSKKVYFDKEYNGSGSAVENGCKVTFSDLKMQTQTIKIRDGIIYDIVIKAMTTGCTVTVDGSNNLTYSKQSGITRMDSPSANQPPSIPGNVDGMKTVIIDPGHGGHDPGAIGYDSKGTAVAYESQINLAIGKLVRDKLTSAGINVIMTRDTDVFIPLSGRADIENNSNCDAFVSIHCNSIDNPDISGTQVYYHPASDGGTLLANNIYNSMVAITGLSPKKTQNGSHLYVIRTTKSPAALVETAFISSPSDRSVLQSASGQDKIARAICEGIIKTLNEL